MRNQVIDSLRAVRIAKDPYYMGEDGIFKTYLNTNEQLDKVLSVTNIEGKRVLTVLASSDQLFKYLELGAESVDTFDMNYLTKYLFYLKKNYFLIFDKFLGTTSTKDELYTVLETFDTHNEDELEAYLFWKELLPIISENKFFNLFYIHPEEKGFNKKILRERLQDFKPNFSLLNVFDNDYYTNKKYDVIIMSNILESTGILSKAHEQLSRLVQSNGEIICSNIATYEVGEHSIYMKKQKWMKNLDTMKVYGYMITKQIDHIKYHINI